MPFYISRPGSTNIFKIGNRLMSPTPYAVFEAEMHHDAPDFLAIQDWQRYRPPRPTVAVNEVIEVRGPVRGISKAEWEELFEIMRALQVRQAITDHLESVRAPKFVSGQINCPICETGQVAFSRASNGHIEAQCTTSDCVHWIE